jgi:hypothetical protein
MCENRRDLARDAVVLHAHVGQMLSLLPYLSATRRHVMLSGSGGVVSADLVVAEQAANQYAVS